MPEEKDNRKEFLDKFTEEIISNIAGDAKKKEAEKRERARIKHEVGVQKFKQKFVKEIIPKIKPGAPPIVNLVPKEPPIQQPKPAPIVVKKPEEKKPAAPIVQKPRPAPVPAQKPIPPLIKIEAPANLPEVQPGEINFGKIALLIKDPLITYIECPNPDKNIIIRKAGTNFTTQIKMTKEEILLLIRSFSEKTRIPLVEGMLTARYENIEISAVVSETLEPSFIIKKDIIPPLQKPQTQLLSPTKPYINPTAPKNLAPGNPMRPAARINPQIQRPFQQRPMPQTQQQSQNAQPKKKESFFSKKIKFGK